MGRGLRIKICGLTSPADLDAAVAAGADAVGLNFHPASPRSVDPERARTLLRLLPPFIEAVGVFVRRSIHDCRTLAGDLGLRSIQVHGGPAETVDAFPYRYVPAFQVREEADLAAIDRYLDDCRQAGVLPTAILVDGHAPGLHGGTGQRAPWDLLVSWRPIVPLILAGGLTPENVALAVRTVRPWAVDVASGVESEPGRKDPDKMRRFIEEARATS